MSFFTEAMRMFSPFGARSGSNAPANPGAGAEASGPGETAGNELEALKRQMAEMQAKLEALSNKQAETARPPPRSGG